MIINDIIFSFIIPVYNVKDYLDRCVESVLKQSFDKRNYEIILVDDGSTDGSSDLCDKWGNVDAIIRVIHKVNGGLSDARNVGLANAHGLYSIFLDSDDYVSTDTCSNFYAEISKHEIYPDVIAGVTRKHEDEKITIIKRTVEPNVFMTGRDYLKKELKGKIFVAAWSCIYKTSFLIDNELYFFKGVLHEDEDFTPRVFLVAQTVLYTDIIFYEYVIRTGSITTSKNKMRNAKSIFIICKNLLKAYENISDEELRNLLYTHSAKICLRSINDANLYFKDNRNIVDVKLLEKVCIHNYEIFRLNMWKMHPYVLMWWNKLLKLRK